MKKIILIVLVFLAVIRIISASTTKDISKSKQISPTPTSTATSTPIVTVTPVITPDPYANMPKYNVKLSTDIQKYLWDKCKSNNWEYEVVLSLLKIESNLNTKVTHRNSNGTVDYGLAQINSSGLRWYGKELAGIQNFDPYNPYHSIDACIGGLNYYRTYWQNKGITGQELVTHVLNSYNMGLGGFEKYKRKTGNVSRGYDRKVRTRQSELITQRRFVD